LSGSSTPTSQARSALGSRDRWRDRPSSTAPVIGLTTYLEQSQTGVWDVPAAFLPKVYFDAVNRAGGIAVLLPPQPVDAAIASRVLDGLDGLIISGGKDVDPARYGQAAHPATDEPRRDRDAWEDALLMGAIDRDLPLGGTLHQHLPDVIGSERYNAGGGVFVDNHVLVDADSHIAGLIGGAVIGKSYHHQSIDRVADGLVVTARTDDGTVQAVELPDLRFGVAVQWHPEQDSDDIRLFEGLVSAARDYSNARQKGSM
jgi:putative glutamine amidotransferase